MRSAYAICLRPRLRGCVVVLEAGGFGHSGCRRWPVDGALRATDGQGDDEREVIAAAGLEVADLQRADLVVDECLVEAGDDAEDAEWPDRLQREGSMARFTGRYLPSPSAERRTVRFVTSLATSLRVRPTAKA